MQINKTCLLYCALFSQLPVPVFFQCYSEESSAELRNHPDGQHLNERGSCDSKEQYSTASDRELTAEERER